MLSINDLKTGIIFEDLCEPWQVLEYQHSKMGRGGAVLRTKIKNLKTGAILNRTFQSSEKFKEVRLERKKAQYLYEDSGSVFMDTSNYEQFILPTEITKDALKYIKEGDEIQLAFFDGKPISIDLPIKVKLRVSEAAKADKGNTATAATKQVVLETGLSVNTPLFIKEGDLLVIDTRDGSYVERA
ncbi:MAG: elongation factor P [Patescibacteria group bacterium]|nr:elongation factor P [Patescibacteria group bacterium]